MDGIYTRDDLDVTTSVLVTTSEALVPSSFFAPSSPCAVRFRVLECLGKILASHFNSISSVRSKQNEQAYCIRSGIQFVS